MSWYDFLDPTRDPAAADRSALSNQSAAAGGFADQSSKQFFGDNANIDAVRNQLQQQANGTLSLSGEQLRQGLQSNLAAQQSMAAGASPSNQAMAARLAMQNGAKLGYGLSGQMATAGIQEREAAAQQLANLNLQQRQQDMQAALGGYGTAVQGYGAGVGNPAPTFWGQVGPAIGAGLGIAAKSDVRAKTNIDDADDESKHMLERLKSYRYDYKDERDGKGSQYGIMAQDLEKAGLKHAVIDTPKGKYVDGAKAATSAIALTAALARRVSKLEGK